MRLQSHTLLSFLMPAASRVPYASTTRRQALLNPSNPQKRCGHPFSTACRSRAQTAAVAEAKPDTEPESELSQRESMRQYDPIGGLLDEADLSSIPPKPKYPQVNKSRISDSLDALFPIDSNQRGKSDSVRFNRPGSIRQGDIASSMLMPRSEGDSPKWADGNHTSAPRRHHTIRSSPSVGRTVDLESDTGGDLGRAFKELDRIVAGNKIKTIVRTQKYHERPGVKRKRLKSLRWRRYFKAGFKATVARVNMMRKQGW